MLKTPIPPNASVTETCEPITQQEEFENGAHTISAVREQAQPGTLADFSAFSESPAKNQGILRETTEKTIAFV